jgi:hypothetical protein
MSINQTGTYAVPRLEVGEPLMEYMANEDTFIAGKVAPIWNSRVKSGKYAAITRESLLKRNDGKRGPRGQYNRIDIGTEDKSFACVERGWEYPLGDDERAMYQSDFDAYYVSSQAGALQALINQEIAVASALFNTSTFTGASLYTDKSGSPWSTSSTDVVSHVQEAIDKVRANSGAVPNTIIMSYSQIANLVKNDDIQDRIKYTKGASNKTIINSLPDIFGVEKVLIGSGVYDSANEGLPSTITDIWSDDYVMVAITNPELIKPSIARTFLWVEDSPSNPVVESYREENTRGEIVRVRYHIDIQVCEPYFGHLLKVNA